MFSPNSFQTSTYPNLHMFKDFLQSLLSLGCFNKINCQVQLQLLNLAWVQLLCHTLQVSVELPVRSTGGRLATNILSYVTYTWGRTRGYESMMGIQFSNGTHRLRPKHSTPAPVSFLFPIRFKWSGCWLSSWPHTNKRSCKMKRRGLTSNGDQLLEF